MKTKLCLIKISLLLCVLVLSKTILAQSKSLIKAGGGLCLGVNQNIFSTNDSIYKKFIESNKQQFTNHTSVGINIWLKYLIKRKLDLQAGIGYRQLGFNRKQENLVFNQPTYPGIGTGKIEDLSNTKKSIYYAYSFHYIHLPLLLNWQKFTSFDYKYRIAFTAGIDFGFLLNHKLTAKTNTGFYIDGENKFRLDSSGFSGNPFISTVMLGAKAEFNLDKKTEMFVQPLLFISPFSLTQQPFSAIPFGAILNIGITYAFKE